MSGLTYGHHMSTLTYMRIAIVLTLLLLGARTASAEEPPPSEVGYLRSDVLKWTAVSIAAVHLADHVVRNNHSGWPFTNKVTPATAAYLGIPAIVGAGIYFDGPLYWVFADSLLLAAALATHTLVEPPHDVHEPWSNGSNLLSHDSGATGTLAVAVTGALVVSTGAHLISNIMDGRKHGFTMRRTKRERRSPVVVAPVQGGGMVSGGWRF
jgi:hypothetical protein